MKRGALILVIVSLFAWAPALAQNSVGGAAKRTVIGGPVKPASPVLPGPKVGTPPVPPTPPPVSRASLAPVSPVTPPRVSTAFRHPPAHLKCRAGACMAKGRSHAVH